MGKPAPRYWWDFVDNATAVIVQSDYKGGSELARFAVHKSAETPIMLAEQLISDFEAGRKTPKWNTSN